MIICGNDMNEYNAVMRSGVDTFLTKMEIYVEGIAAEKEQAEKLKQKIK